MDIKQLTEAIFEDDIRRVNYFNGRLLSGEDMRTEQEANRAEHRRLGRAIGEGIAYGLEVMRAPNIDRPGYPTVTITPGLAIDRRGQTLVLANLVDLSLKAQATIGASSGARDTTITPFEVCVPVDTDPYVAGAGLYLLTVGEVEGKQGRAAASGLGNVEASCNAKYLVPGVRFRLIRLPLDPAELEQPDLLRNRVAYRCFMGDPPVQDAFHVDPFGASATSYGLIDSLRPTWLKNCEVPLAIVYLTDANGLIFVDMWSVRRRITAPAAATRLPLLTSDRRAAEGEAMVMQFQDQIQDMLQPGSGENFRHVDARSRFRYLPPVGLLPIATDDRRQTAKGFTLSSFFAAVKYRAPIYIEAAQMRLLLLEAFNYPPIDTSSGLVVWLYLVRENGQAVESSSRPPAPYLVFASGHTPYRGEPRYDVRHWNFSNFA